MIYYTIVITLSNSCIQNTFKVTFQVLNMRMLFEILKDKGFDGMHAVEAFITYL